MQQNFRTGLGSKGKKTSIKNNIRSCLPNRYCSGNTLVLLLASWILVVWSSEGTILPWLAENGWKPLGARSDDESFLSRPLDLLNPAVSVFSQGLGIAEIAPDFKSFLATSLASLASAGLFRAGVFSCSILGAFRACKAFFCNINNNSGH